MDKSSKPQYCFLLVMCILICRCLSDATTQDQRQASAARRSVHSIALHIEFLLVFCINFLIIFLQVYIVYMGAHHHSPNKLEEKHVQMLQQVVDER